ncbi:hypothetical protein LY78DRAFT_677330 [Colletotrichum sublineola]|nr:hypothetical protein LY78DRAFT_677330 [Colletotrichum sublineola]
MAPAILGRAQRAPTATTTTTTTTTTTSSSTPTPTPVDAYSSLSGSPPSSGITAGEKRSPSTVNVSTTTTLIIVVVVLCVAAVVMSAALFYLFDRKKHAQFREACKRDPYLTRKEFLRRRKLSALERLQEEEAQRSIMIRKSLASREPSRRNSYEDFNLARLQQEHQQHQQLLQHRLQQEYRHGGRPVSVWMPRMRSASELSSSSSSASSSSSSSSSTTLQHPYYPEPHPGIEVDATLTPHSRSPSPSPIRTPRVRLVVPPPAVWEMEEMPSPGLSKPSDAPVHLS